MSRRIDDDLMPGMGFPPRPPGAPRRFREPQNGIEAVRFFTGLFGTFITAMSCISLASYYIDASATGTVQSFKLHKGTCDVVLTNGVHTTYPDSVLMHVRGQPLSLRAGDVIGKEQYSFVYFLNGAAVTDFAWAWHQSVESTAIVALFAVFAASDSFIVLRRRPSATSARHPTGVPILVRPVYVWVVAIVIEIIAFELFVHVLYLLLLPFHSAP